MKKQLDENCEKIDRSLLLDFENSAFEKIEEFMPYLSKSEFSFMIGSVKAREVPTPYILIKDHKAIDENGCYPTRFIVPCNNYLSCFSRLGYVAIKGIFDKNSVKYSQFNILNSYKLVEKVKTANFQNSKNTIFNIDVRNMYPSISLSLIKEALLFFSSVLPEEEQKMVMRAWAFGQFGMDGSIMQFGGEYYRYVGAQRSGEASLSIGGFESAFYADLVMSFIFQKAQLAGLFEDFAVIGIYRDDGFAISRDRVSDEWLDSWLQRFQGYVSSFAPSIEFTLEKWSRKTDSLSFLDLEFSWDLNGFLAWKVYKKPGTILKYLNHDSPGHTAKMVGNIQTNVLERLARLTSINSCSENSTIESFYPEHTAALDKAGLRNT